MEGVTKVIDELGKLILAKNLEIELQQDEINRLREKIEMIESYLDAYDNFYNDVNNVKTLNNM